MRKLQGEDQDQGFKFDVTEYVRVLWRKKFVIILPLVFSVVVAYVGSRFLPPVYQASAVLRIENPNLMNRDLERMVQTGRQRIHDAEMAARVRSNVASSGFLDELSRTLGFDKDPEVIRRAELAQASVFPDVSLDELVMRRLRGMLRKRIKVERAGPGLFQIAYLDANPEACYIVADAMSKLYIEEQEKLQFKELAEVSDFSDEQLGVYRERLDRSERELEAFQQRMSKIMVESNPVTEKNIGVARSLRRQLEIDVADLTRIVEDLEQRLVKYVGSVPDSSRVMADRAVRNMIDDLNANVNAELLLELQGAGSATATSLSSKQEIADIQQDLLNRISDIIRGQYTDVSRDYRPLIDEYVYQLIQRATRERKLANVQQYISTFQRNVDLAPQLNTELQRLQAEVKQNRTLYEQFLRTKTSTSITEAAHNTDLATSIEVVERATYPFEPVKPNKIKILALAVMFGLTMGLGGLLVSEFTDTSFKSVEDVEKRLDLRVLGTVPKIEEMGASWRGENRLRKVVIWSTTTIVLTTVAIFAFYFYGKSTKENMVTFRITAPKETTGGPN
jgi:succinoglycan biosynthesis transport protein ExoP